MDKDNIKDTLRKYICSKIIKDETHILKNNEPLISSGIINSFSLIHLAVFVEKEFGIKIPDTELNLDNMNTIDSFVDCLERWNIENEG